MAKDPNAVSIQRQSTAQFGGGNSFAAAAAERRGNSETQLDPSVALKAAKRQAQIDEESALFQMLGTKSNFTKKRRSRQGRIQS